MAAATTDRWIKYYEATAGRPPRDTLLRALDAFEREGMADCQKFALDLGAGDGRDTVEILQRGWRVLAIDSEPKAFERLRARPDLVRGEALETQIERIEDADLPSADLINASFALPFCAPDRFSTVWSRIVGALKPGGRFAGQLLGVRDDWAKEPNVTCFERDDARALLEELVVEHFEEEETQGSSSVGKAKHWHIFHIVARKPSA